MSSACRAVGSANGLWSNPQLDSTIHQTLDPRFQGNVDVSLWNPKHIVPFIPETQRICLQDTSWESRDLDKASWLPYGTIWVRPYSGNAISDHFEILGYEVIRGRQVQLGNDNRLSVRVSDLCHR